MKDLKAMKDHKPKEIDMDLNAEVMDVVQALHYDGHNASEIAGRMGLDGGDEATVAEIQDIINNLTY